MPGSRSTSCWAGHCWEKADSDGPPRRFTADEVRTISAEMTRTGFDQLSQGVELSDLEAEGIYPSIWDEPDALDYVRGYYDELVTFFAGPRRPRSRSSRSSPDGVSCSGRVPHCVDFGALDDQKSTQPRVTVPVSTGSGGGVWK
ncbi:DUF1877 family protein [Amycolatopsis sp. lyj-108]|uniref:DUF1877 family protein n=1 Tax=Amycolatopsis sp. lyj-108 TaxID=2789286 RepID=UPI00397A15E2